MEHIWTYALLNQLIHILSIELNQELSVNTRIAYHGLCVQDTSTSEIIRRVLDAKENIGEHCFLGFLDDATGEFTAVLEVQPQSPQEGKYSEILCFRKIESPMDTSPYASELLQSLSSNRRYLDIDGSYICMYPSRGTYRPSLDRTRLVICTPCFGRLGLLKVYCHYMVTYYMPQLIWGGYDVCLLLCGGDEEKHAVSEYLSRPNVLFFVHDNNLGRKKNTMFDFAKVAEFDFATTIDSDDFVHPETTVDLIALASQNGKWSSIEPFYFKDVEEDKEGLFEGYRHGHQLCKWGMGSARVFTQSALKLLGDIPFGSGNRSMDDTVKSQLNSFDLEWEDRLISTENCRSHKTPIPIGIKGSSNIWGLKHYAVKSIDTSDKLIDWLPPEIEHLLSELRRGLL